MLEQSRKEDSEGFLGTPLLGYERWRDAIHLHCGRYTPGGTRPQVFAGRMRARSLCGLAAIDISCNAPRIERTRRDARSDGREHYYALFQITGRSVLLQHDDAAELSMGDVALVDAAQPIICVCQGRGGQWTSLQLPRRSLVSHLGWEPRSLLCRHDGPVGARLLLQLLCDGVHEETASPASANPYLHLTFYDLIGALFASSDEMSVSLHTDRSFARVCALIRDRYTDPAFGPHTAAAEAGISLRYLQKLFTMRDLTCGDFIHRARLDHAMRLLQRRARLKTGQSISAIAYSSGFGDYAFFARKFRQRFGHSPGVHNVGSS